MTSVLVVGAGLSGAVAARTLAERGADVLVLEKRPHIGGNVYDMARGNGVLAQVYGAHLFHTNNAEVMEYLKGFADFFPYRHQVLANIRGLLVPVPFRFSSIRQTFPPEKAEAMIALLLSAYGEGAKIPILELRKNEHPLLKELAEYVYENIFARYTAKQWQMSLADLDPAVGMRVPVVATESGGYFTDTFQCMPEGGFTKMADRILSHPRVRVICGCDALSRLTLCGGEALLDGQPFLGRIIYTGCLDELFGFAFGRLPYRSLRFDFADLPMDCFQPCGVVNYTVTEDYTRILEFKHFMKRPPAMVTTIAYEYPCAHDGTNTPYYPVPSTGNNALYARYADELIKYPQITALGRLAQYQYYNMDEAVAAALAATSK
jgi:UDP-galactopyranose mutase